ncbi:unnamed protein product [Cuscuta europaea]|uniref:Uncharacterized protein n=1 Tax=Cuscuta europaea TaxID=41803 RepID=A0A9P0YJP7_CUSEU|nr:unnamed protein product [Cuscuta europaea]
MHKMHLLSVSLLYNNSFLNYDQTLFSGKRVTRQPGDAPMSRVPPGLGLEGDTSRPGGHDGRVIAAWTIVLKWQETLKHRSMMPSTLNKNGPRCWTTISS